MPEKIGNKIMDASSRLTSRIRIMQFAAEQAEAAQVSCAWAAVFAYIAVVMLVIPIASFLCPTVTRA